MPDQVSRYTFSASGQDSVKAAFKSIEQAAQQASRNAVRAAKEQQRATVRAATASARAAKARSQDQRRQQIREAQAVAKAEKRSQQERLKAQKQHARESARIAKQQQRELMKITRETTQQIERARSRRRDARAGRRAAIANVGAGVALGIGGAAIAGGAALLSRGADAVGQATRESINLQDRSIRLAIKGGGADKFNPTLIRQTLEDTSRGVRGIKADDLAGGLEAFVGKTGDLGKALDFTEVFASISVATGTAAQEVGAAAADLFEKFDVKTVEGMNKALSTLAVQGKRGAFEMEDAAAQFPKIAAAAQRFGLRGEEGVATLGGLSQIARRATPSGEEAATSVENLFKQLVAKSDLIKKETGTTVFKDENKTVTRDVKDIIVETIAGAKGNQQTLQKVFDVRGVRAVSPLISLFNQTKQGATGTEAERTAQAVAALRMEIEKAIDATGAEAEMKRDLASAQTQSSVQLTAAWETLRSKVGDNVAPAMVKMINDLLPVVEDLDFQSMADDISSLGSAAKKAAEFLGLMKGKTDIQRDLRTTARDERRAQKKFDRVSALADKRGGIDKLSADELRQLANAGVALTKAGEASKAADKRSNARAEFIAAAQKDGITIRSAERIADQVIADPTLAEKGSTARLFENLGFESSQGGELMRKLATGATGTQFDDKGQITQLGAGVDPSVAEAANGSLSGLSTAAGAAMTALEAIAGRANSIFFD